MGTVITLDRHRGFARKAVSWSQVTSEGEEFCSYCLMLIQQLDCLRSGHTIDLPRLLPVASVRRAQDALKERGYPTDFQEDGGQFGWGVLTFQ